MKKPCKRKGPPHLYVIVSKGGVTIVSCKKKKHAVAEAYPTDTIVKYYRA